jgi:Tol biopolymer transport system component
MWTGHLSGILRHLRRMVARRLAAVPGSKPMNRWKVAAALVLLAGALGAGVALFLPGVADEQGAEPPNVRPDRIFAHVLFPPTLAEVFAAASVRYGRVLAIDPETGKGEQINEQGGLGRVSPDGRAVVFVRDGEIWSCDSRGKEGPRRLAAKGGRPVWSADGTWLVLTARARGAAGDLRKKETWRINADGSGATTLPIPDTDTVDDVSPDGRWFVTCSDRHPPRGLAYQLYLMRPDGTGQRRLTQGAGLSFDARFSPDGRQLVYVHMEKDIRGVHFSSVHVMDADGGNDREVLREKDQVRPDSACWSPDGRRLAVVVVQREAGTSRDLQGWPILFRDHLEILDADGGNRRRLKLRTADNAAILAEQIGAPDWHVRPPDR